MSASRQLLTVPRSRNTLPSATLVPPSPRRPGDASPTVYGRRAYAESPIRQEGRPRTERSDARDACTHFRLRRLRSHEVVNRAAKPIMFIMLVAMSGLSRPRAASWIANARLASSRSARGLFGSPRAGGSTNFARTVPYRPCGAGTLSRKQRDASIVITTRERGMTSPSSYSARTAKASSRTVTYAPKQYGHKST